MGVCLQLRELESASESNSRLEETERLKEDVSLLKRESKLSRKAEKTGQDSVVLLNRELQQVVQLQLNSRIASSDC